MGSSDCQLFFFNETRCHEVHEMNLSCCLTLSRKEIWMFDTVGRIFAWELLLISCRCDGRWTVIYFLVVRRNKCDLQKILFGWVKLVTDIGMRPQKTFNKDLILVIEKNIIPLVLNVLQWSCISYGDIYSMFTFKKSTRSNSKQKYFVL